MKIKLTLIISFISCLILIFPANGQSWDRELGLGYTFMSPLGTMQKNIKQGHGITGDFYFKQVGSRLGFGLEMSYTLYGHDESRQEYTFSDGSTAPMDIMVNNGITTFMLAGRYYLRDENILRPYIAAKAGYSWFRTDLNIYDPADWDHCEPVDRDILLKDGTWVVSAAGGFQWDLSALFKKLKPEFLLLNASANLTLGNQVSYMNTDAPSHQQPAASDVRARFINNQTQVVHEHHVGYVYSSFVETLDFRVGMVIRSSR